MLAETFIKIFTGTNSQISIKICTKSPQNFVLVLHQEMVRNSLPMSQNLNLFKLSPTRNQPQACIFLSGSAWTLLKS
jgi:hypothetical protein